VSASSADGYVIDASALLALLQGEAGADTVEAVVDRSVVSTVNWCEIYQRSLARRASVVGLRAEVQALGVGIVQFTAADAERAAELWSSTRALGLSLGDRACLALAERLERIAVTADRRWLELDLGVEVEAIR
jgi:ribonuclease VapC